MEGSRSRRRCRRLTTRRQPPAPVRRRLTFPPYRATGQITLIRHCHDRCQQSLKNAGQNSTVNVAGDVVNVDGHCEPAHADSRSHRRQRPARDGNGFRHRGAGGTMTRIDAYSPDSVRSSCSPRSSAACRGRLALHRVAAAAHDAVAGRDRPRSLATRHSRQGPRRCARRRRLDRLGRLGRLRHR